MGFNFGVNWPGLCRRVGSGSTLQSGTRLPSSVAANDRLLEQNVSQVAHRAHRLKIAPHFPVALFAFLLADDAACFARLDILGLDVIARDASMCFGSPGSAAMAVEQMATGFAVEFCEYTHVDYFSKLVARSSIISRP